MVQKAPHRRGRARQAFAPPVEHPHDAGNAQFAEAERQMAYPPTSAAEPAIPYTPYVPPANSGANWYVVDDEGAVALRQSPSMESKTPTALQPGAIVYAAENLGGWIKNEEGLWLPTGFLVPFAAEKLQLTEAAHRRKEAGVGGQPRWYRVDDGGSVCFRRSSEFYDKVSTGPACSLPPCALAGSI
jgi:hypothetical protein